MESLNLVQNFAVWALPVIFAITLHEVAHGRVARALGDPTAQEQGRLSLNPLRHVDPVGTVLVPAVLLLSHAGFLIGWAKPVPVDWRKFKDPRRDMAVVAAAGPLSNLAMAVGWGVLLKISLLMGGTGGAWYGVALMARAGILINASLMVLNLLPIPPLDGGRVAVGLLPMRAAVLLARIEPYGMLILVLLVFGHVLTPLLSWPLAAVLSLIARFLDLPVD
ncbi:MAG: site-2 protease family protein [Nevskia sp.]|nr:site-2 protease family protein [Nevskia sp.]